ncbi:UDP-N-acetylmuramoyl-L-alanine--D-glutamate ligase [Simkania sp.]|uniref:UDP-N-acetylmuramoyl-L-alanine--D-glutamate ligase n=1 Tax=Simkania sp. TaxID=34094 RepID=UPI003B5281AD
MKTVLIVGYGISGRGAEKLLLKLGYEVVIADQTVEVPAGDFEFAVLSPGIPQGHPLPSALKTRNVPVIGEAELAFRHLKGAAIGVTGTNGKTTLTNFLAHALGGKALGNVGESLAAYAASDQDDDLLVIELSSYQLETLQTKLLDAAILTNITPDHMDRYPSFEAYANTKWHIADCLKEKGVCFVPKKLDDGRFSKVQSIDADSYLQLSPKQGYWAKLDQETLALAFAVCQKFNLSEEAFFQALETFEKPPHRLEYVCEWNGVTFINDSKGTNPAATLYAVSRIPGSILLIVGGDSKGLSFESWKEGLGKKVKAVLTIGEAGLKLQEMLAPFYEVHQMGTLDEATHHASQIAEDGDTVLLSPGCASFDQFENYAQRGDVFKNSIQQLRRGI